ncbi:hypothetical protein Q4517_13985 [Tenacibaculum sp. 1_MG-2023]|uniref:hypothetical protein n=1 Tax=Tenacibaculum sp. 1_MG-2023 TaxID=3062653 RepID=UPI0026E2E5C9|nr:hypothetical protein [Tenacibaculum sp. 1_MG-2023]MDO6676655.1 hypothetical protein [Tenacibaculum sp. 1_MG-2023]
MKTKIPLLTLVTILFFSCSSDTDNVEENIDTGNTGNQICKNPSAFIFNEKDNFILVEFENNDFPTGWELKTNSSTTGKGYYVWTGNQSLGKPGSGLVEFKLNIKNPGVYRFLWSSAVTQGNSGSDHNDSWLKFPDADDFYGEKEGSKVYPKGTGKTPNPKGTSADGWFKIYRSGNNLDFKWQAATSDNDSHKIYVKFEKPGVYSMQVSVRSSGHGIDKFMLFNESYYTQNNAIQKTSFSEITCN